LSESQEPLSSRGANKYMNFFPMPVQPMTQCCSVTSWLAANGRQPRAGQVHAVSACAPIKPSAGCLPKRASPRVRREPWICIYAYMYKCIYVYFYICIYVYVYMYICICIYGWAQKIKHANAGHELVAQEPCANGRRDPWANGR